MDSSNKQTIHNSSLERGRIRCLAEWCGGSVYLGRLENGWVGWWWETGGGECGFGVVDGRVSWVALVERWVGWWMGEWVE